MASRNVLVTAASRRVALVQAFRRAVRALDPAARVVVTDVNTLSPAVHVGDRAYEVPLAGEPGYVDALIDVCVAEDVTLVVPTIDDELPVLATARPRFEALGIRVAVSPRETTEICNDKLATCEHLRRHGVAAARSWLPEELTADTPLPLFVKPRFGRGSIGAFQARTARERDFFATYVEQPVLQEFLPGREFTIDLFCDFGGRPLSVVPRERVVIRAGVIDRGRTVADPALIDLALACARALPFHGAVNLQCRITDGRPVIFEINPRFSGGIPLTIAAGANFPAMLVALADGREVAPAIGRFIDDLWMTNYESSIFLDAETAAAALAPVPTGAAAARIGAVA
ncbi:MAG: ATP-grasp domain-containing protein [Vicinamibacterales bacterium]